MTVPPTTPTPLAPAPIQWCCFYERENVLNMYAHTGDSDYYAEGLKTQIQEPLEFEFVDKERTVLICRSKASVIPIVLIRNMQARLPESIRVEWITGTFKTPPMLQITGPVDPADIDSRFREALRKHFPDLLTLLSGSDAPDKLNIQVNTPMNTYNDMLQLVHRKRKQTPTIMLLCKIFSDMGYYLNGPECKIPSELPGFNQFEFDNDFCRVGGQAAGERIILKFKRIALSIDETYETVVTIKGVSETIVYVI